MYQLNVSAGIYVSQSKLVVRVGVVGVRKLGKSAFFESPDFYLGHTITIVVIEKNIIINNTKL